jgi:hypothetical protein
MLDDLRRHSAMAQILEKDHRTEVECEGLDKCFSPIYATKKADLESGMPFGWFCISVCPLLRVIEQRKNAK